MSLQSIINLAETVKINRRKIIGIQYSRNQVAKTSELVGRNPWRMAVKVSAMLAYDTIPVRRILEELDRIDRKIPEVITFSDSSSLSWMLAYKGAMSASELSGLAVVRLGGTGYAYNEMVVTGLPTVGTRSLPTAVMFEAGDFVQVAGLPYPFTVTQQVLRGEGSTVTLTLHRESFLDPAECAGQDLLVGNAVSFNMLCANMPTYSFVANNRIQFDDTFELYEYTGTIV